MAWLRLFAVTAVLALLLACASGEGSAAPKGSPPLRATMLPVPQPLTATMLPVP
jgi:hypothetical protein